MTWKIKIKGDKYIAEVVSDDLSHAIFKVDEWRSQGAEVWIEDVNGNKVDEATLSKAADQIHWSDYGFRKRQQSSVNRGRAWADIGGKACGAYLVILGLSIICFMKAIAASGVGWPEGVAMYSASVSSWSPAPGRRLSGFLVSANHSPDQSWYARIRKPL
jgi:hypothetical protein